jgi:hypothetical protein
MPLQASQANGSVGGEPLIGLKPSNRLNKYKREAGKKTNRAKSLPFKGSASRQTAPVFSANPATAADASQGPDP